MKKVLIALSFMVMFGLQVIAQTTNITGTVTDAADGSPIPGVSVFVKGTTIGTVTMPDGKYNLAVPNDATAIVFSFVGMTAQEVAYTGQTNISVVMESDAVDVGEVVVTAYGTAKKSSFTGSATTIKGEKLAELQSSNLAKSLEGNVSGVQITSNSGQPGDGGNIIVRGIGSISAGINPLIVVDGVPYEGSLNSIAPQDIETMTVLKDAAANSMYGARGSNGVIMITTKKGKEGKLAVNLDARYGVNSRGVPTYDIITDPGEYYPMIWESLRNNYASNGYGQLEANQLASQNLISGALIYNIYEGVPDDQVVNPLTGKLNPNATKLKWKDKWTEEPFNNGIRQDYNLNFSSATEKINFYSSLGYLSDEGYIEGSEFNRISTRVKVDYTFNKNLKMGANMAYVNTKKNTSMSPDNLSAYSNVFMFSQNIAPIYPVYLYDINTGEPQYDADGNRKYDFGTENQRPYASEQNPAAVYQQNLNENIQDNLSSRGYMEFNFLNDFKFTLNVAYDLFNTNNTEFDTPLGGDALSVGGRGYKTTERYSALNMNQLLNYNKEFDNHGIKVLLGHETKYDEQRYLLGHMTNFVNPDNPEFANATVYQDLTSYKNEYTLEGYFSRLEYEFSDRYYLTASLRYDGSSRFSADERWGSFWALGASWRVSEESFMQGVDWVNNLKVKASYGTQGNDNVGSWYAYRDLYAVDRVDGSPAMRYKFRGNEDLTWEKSKNFNAGIETRIFDRANINFDFFIKDLTDMLFQSPLATSLGNPSWIWRNEMDMRNTGFEVDVNVDLLQRSNLRWNVNANITHYKNELTKLPAQKDQDGYQAGAYWREKGGTIYDWYTYEYAGVDPTNGKPLYNKYEEDEEGNEVVTTVNRTSEATLRKTGKSALPDFYGGFGTTLNAYGFDLSVQCAYQIGGYSRDGSYAGLMNGGGPGDNMHKDMFDRWTLDNPNTNVPALMYEDQDVNSGSDRWLTSSSYLSIRNITLGYTIPKRLSERASISNLRLYLIGDNLWFTSERKGFDPRQNPDGSVGFNYSALRTVSVGLSITL